MDSKVTTRTFLRQLNLPWSEKTRPKYGQKASGLEHLIVYEVTVVVRMDCRRIFLLPEDDEQELFWRVLEGLLPELLSQEVSLAPTQIAVLHRVCQTVNQNRRGPTRLLSLDETV